MTPFTFIELFAGIGGFRIAFQNVGGTCLFASEWDKYAAKSYEANFGELPHGDITKIPIENIPDHDVLTAGFPCQPFSIAGVTKNNALGIAHGFEHATQGTLFFDVARIIKAKKPKAFLLENVKNLMRHDGGRTYETILNVLEDELDYRVYPELVDARSVVPQHRERIYLIGFRDPIAFELPKLPNLKPRFENILERNVDDKYTLTNHLWKYLRDYADKHRAKGNGFGFGLTDLEGIARTLSARYYKDGSEILIQQKGKNPRRLTPRECARLMGFPEEFKIEVSDTRAYKQFGNSVVVPVVEHIAREMAKSLFEEILPKRNVYRKPRQRSLSHVSSA
ncbi:MAG TPA: DNA (cytosine-5-)-methyltransferase [Pyrinomonadaceae bacterium]|jgi:DNA (cytosine-5)-methyltransferase 1